MVSIMRDQEWKDVRSSVTPAFTTGKIKRYSVLIKECADRLNNKFDKLAKADGKIDAKRQFSAFTMDVIARCAFGMKIDNLGEKDDEFMRRAQAVFSPPANRSPIVMLPFAIPRLMQYLGERIFFSEDFKFFTDLMENLILERSQSTQKYHDFVEVATEAIMDYTKEENGKKVPMWEREEVDEIVAAQSAIFLVAGFDTTATTLTASSFLLAKNPEVQEKLYDQIMSKMEQYGDVCHEMIADLPYVDHIVNEVLRMNPPVPRVERECREDITLNGRIKIKKGMVVTVPAYAIHYMEEYYPDPKTFNPERWDAENKANRNPYAFFPFGMGPRNCIGMRFALEEIKIALCSLVKQYRFFPIDETPENFTFEDGMFGVLQPHDTFIGIANR
jgi:cytochrome P450